MKDANKEALEHLFAVLDGAMAPHKTKIDAQAAAIHEAEIRRISAERGAHAAEEGREVREADENTVKEAFSHTKRALTMTVANGYLKRHYAPAIAADLHANLTAIQARVAALSRIRGNDQPVVVQAVEDAADKKTRDWLDANRTLIANLPEERRAVYKEIRDQAREPELVATELPTALRLEGADDEGQPLPVRPKHVLSDADGKYPIDTKARKEWERKVIDQELVRPTVVAWYRNPSTASKYSLRIAYRKAGDGAHCSRTSSSWTRTATASSRRRSSTRTAATWRTRSTGSSASPTSRRGTGRRSRGSTQSTSTRTRCCACST